MDQNRIAAALAANDTLTVTLAELGMRHRRSHATGSNSRHVVVADGLTVFVGTADDVWRWLRYRCSFTLDGRHIEDIEAFIEVNEFGSQATSKIRAMLPGDELLLGGGVATSYWVTRNRTGCMLQRIDNSCPDCEVRS